MMAGAAWGPTGDESQGSPVLSQQQGVDLGARASESQGHSGTQVADDVVMTGTISRFWNLVQVRQIPGWHIPQGRELARL